MSRSRGSEMPQRQSPRAPLHLRMLSSDSDGVHSSISSHSSTDRSPKTGDRRSPRNPVVEKKRGTRVSELESQLCQAQDELKILKEQLASAEAAKKEVQDELEKTKKHIPAEAPLKSLEPIEKDGAIFSSPMKLPENVIAIEKNSSQTDVSEVPAVPIEVEPDAEVVNATDVEDFDTRSVEECSESLHEQGKILIPDPSTVIEISELRAILEEKEKELECLQMEKEDLKQRVTEAVAEVAALHAKEEESALKLSRVEKELEECRSLSAQLGEELKGTVAEKLALESEMKKMKVQTEQWKKAADEAAAVLAGEVEMMGRASERYGSMDKHIGGSFDSAGLSSPMADEWDDGLGNAKRRTSGIRMFGDLWKKRGQK